MGVIQTLPGECTSFAADRCINTVVTIWHVVRGIETELDGLLYRIDHLQENPDDLDRLSEAALETARGMTWDHVAKQVESVYEEVR